MIVMALIFASAWLSIGFCAGCQVITTARAIDPGSPDPIPVLVICLLSATLAGPGAMVVNVINGEANTPIEWPFPLRR